jgi:hypothetical protein
MTAPTNLVNLGHGRGQLARPAAESIFRLDKAVGRPVDINSAYRDWNEQWKAYRAWDKYRTYANGGPWAPWAPLALHPDASWHCKGMAIDTDDRWLIFGEHGWRFVVPSEPWHAQYYYGYDKHSHEGLPAGGGGVPLPIPPKPSPEPVPIMEDDDMNPIYRQKIGTNGVYAVDTITGKSRLLTSSEWNVVKLAYEAAKRPVPFARVP